MNSPLLRFWMYTWIALAVAGTMPVRSHAAAANAAWLQGSTLEDGSVTLTSATPLSIRWTESSSIDPTVFDHVFTDPAKLVIKKDGDYLVAATLPVMSVETTDNRPTQAIEVYVNGQPAPGAISQSSYIRNMPTGANMQRESSDHIQVLLTGLKAKDVLELKVYKTAGVSVPTSIQSASLYVERVEASRSVFAALSSGPATGMNLNADVSAGEAAAQLAWKATRKDAGFAHTDGAAAIALGAGTYLVFVNVPMESTIVRASAGLDVTLDGTVVPGGRARQGYIRSTGGHNEVSVHWAGLVQVTGTRSLVLQTSRLAVAGEVKIQTGKQASVFIEKLSGTSGVLFSSATQVDNAANPDDWNPANKTEIVWGPDAMIDSVVFGHLALSSKIQVKQPGHYLLVYNDQLQSTGARVNPRITVEVNGEPVRGAETKTHYIRASDGHNHSSACLVFLLEGLSANDTITVSTQREGNTQATTKDENANEAAILALIKKDNFVLPPGDTTPPRVTYFSGDVFGFEIRIPDLGREIDPSSIAVTVNGAPVKAVANKARGVTTITYAYVPPDYPRTGALQQIGVTFKDMGTPPGAHQVPLSYTVLEPWTEIPSEFAAAGVDKTQSGFIARVTQISEAQHTTTHTHGNLIDGAERQLRGEYKDANGKAYLNEAGPQNATSWVIVPEDVEIINFEQTGASAGNFTGDKTIPRIPGWGATDNGIVAEFLTFLELKKGYQTLGVNSDDGFKATIGSSPKDLLARTVGFWNAGRGAADTLFDIVVREDGIYPFRLLWFEGSGGASVELFSVHNGQKILVNDRSNTNAIRAYRVGPVRPFLTKAEPASGVPAQKVLFEITDDVLKVAPGSVKLALDGTPVTAQTTQNGGVTTVSYDAGKFLPAGEHVVTLTFDESSTPPAQRTVRYSFTIPNGQTAVLLDRPFAYWRLGETSGDKAFSEVGTGLTAQYLGNPTLGAERLVPGDPTPAVLFDKSKGQSVSIPNHADLNERTGNPGWKDKSIELWFKARNLPTSAKPVPSVNIPQRQVLYEQGGVTRGIAIYLSGTQAENPTQAQLWFNALNRNTAEGSWGGTLPIDNQNLSPNGTAVAINTTIEANKVYHIVLVMEGDEAPDSFKGKLIGYINGEKFGEISGVHNLRNHTNPSGLAARNGEVAFHDHVVGAASPDILAANEMFYFDGWMDEVALYNVALSPERIKAHYQAGSTPSEGPPPGTGAPKLTYKLGAAGVLQIEFEGTLQSADTIAGPWSDLSGASPHTVTVGSRAASKFFRARR